MVSLKHYDRKVNVPMRFCRSTSENTKAFTEIHALRRKNFQVFILTQILK